MAINVATFLLGIGFLIIYINMKLSWQILTLLIAVALVILSIKVMQLSGEGEEGSPASKEEAVLEAIMTRSSVRAYTSQAVETEKIEKLLKAGMAAPTAANKQPWQFVVVTDRAVLDALPKIIKGAHMAAKAQLAIVVCGEPAKALMPEYWVQDCSAATENILLAAHAMGLGAVWSGAYPENGTGRVEGITKLLSLPEGVNALSVIVIGYPSAEAKPKDKWKPEKVHYNKY